MAAESAEAAGARLVLQTPTFSADASVMPLHVKEMVSFVLHFLIYTTPCAFMVVLSISGAGRLFSPPPVSGPQTKLDRFLPCELRWLRLFFGFALIPLAFLGLVWLRDGYDRTVNPGCIVLFFL